MKLALTICLISITSCSSNLYIGNSGVKKDAGASGRQIVYVTNPENEGFTLLKNSGLYDISNDKNSNTKLTLESAEIYPRCGTPLAVSVITLGLLPLSLPAPENFIYTISDEESSTQYVHHLDIYERFSVWEWLLKPFKNPDRVRTQALRRSERTKRDPAH